MARETVLSVAYPPEESVTVHYAAIMMSIVPAVSAQAPPVVVIPPGETALGDIGLYRVAYQSYGANVVDMLESWLGHFHPGVGISYVPHERVLGRDAMLIHSPWQTAPGRAFVEYRLRLPDENPVMLSFGIAMRPDVAAPDKSDGVTFGCTLVTAGGEETELLNEHRAVAEWKDCEYNLTEYAGAEVTLRLQVEPGPDNSPSWDYSYFGEARIVAGDTVSDLAERVAELTGAKAYKAYAEADLTALANDPTRGVVPSALLAHENAISSMGESYELAYTGADCDVTYVYAPKTGTLDDFVVWVDETTAFRPAAGGGAMVAVPDGDSERSVRAEGGELVSLEEVGEGIEAVWRHNVEGTALTVNWRFGIEGKALTVEASSEDLVVSGFSLGNVASAPMRKTIGVPYLYGSVAYLSAQNVFAARHLDWTQSNASTAPEGWSSYSKKTDGTRNALREAGYIAISPHVGEVLPNLPNPPSPYLDLLGPKIMLDIWGHHKGTYEGDAENLRALKDAGVDHLAIISHVWQRYGYDVKLPDHLPANPQFGGDEGMVAFGEAANEAGYVWSLHENYIDLYPDAPSYDETAAVLRADGSMSPAWFNKGTGVQSYGLKCNRALGYAEQTAPEVHRRFGTNASYLDVHTCVPPWHQLDHDANQPMAAIARHKVERDSELFAYMRETHGGPLFGEGSNHFYWAGKVDGTEAQVSGGAGHTPLLDFDLLKLHPQMVNHGMGYYERWFPQGYDMRFGIDVGTPRDIDQYRAQELAYGHAGFIGNISTNNVQWVAKEHNLMHPVQRLYGAAKATDIRYEVAGEMVSASVALALGDRMRQRVTYDSGLTVWVNWAEDLWRVEGHVLPQWGALALGPGTEVRTSLIGGLIADYAACPEYVFADARTYFNMPYLKREVDVEPRLAEFEDLGDGKIRVTYEWIVNEELDGDYACFVHFAHPQAKGGDNIVFQQDHALPKPTSEWRPGETITDGPYEIDVPGDGFDSYGILVGLHRGPRVPLKGLRAPGADGRIIVGLLDLTRNGERVTSARLGDISALEATVEEPVADFTANMNPSGTMVDFGAVATDGSVKVYRGRDSLTVIPYPVERAFTVTLDLAELAPNVDGDRVVVTAQAPLSHEPIGTVPFELEDQRLMFQVGKLGAGRFLVTW